jgi:formamidopyrimidine-DNA glycosylase
MPELPEVETVRAGLNELLGDQPIIKQVKLMRPDIRFLIPPELPRLLKNQPILNVRRRAKYLIFETPRIGLLSHLGMTGSWRLLSSKLLAHDHCCIEFMDGRRLVFRDPRRFGLLDLIDLDPRSDRSEINHIRLKKLGPEPLDRSTFTPDSMHSKAKNKRVAVKVFIMDQRNVVGVGNIYASEALFRAKIHPAQPAGQVSLRQWASLIAEIQIILSEAILAGGSTIKDFRQAGGSEGYFQNTFRVYDREGLPCLNCGKLIQNEVLGGRSTYWCAKCQRKRE